MPGSVLGLSDRDFSEKEKTRLDSQSVTRRSSITFSIDSKFSSVPELLLSLDHPQSSGGGRPLSEEKKTDSAAPEPLHPTTDVVFPMESAGFGPLLPPEEYRGRVLTVDSLHRRRIKPGLLGDREKVALRPRIGVVDGIHDLQQAFTGLLCRHNREDLEYAAEHDKKVKKEMGKGAKKDFFLGDPSYGEHLKAQSSPVDDRITPQTLHTLLRHSRATVARILPPSLQPKEVVRYAANMKMEENNPVLLTERAPAEESGALALRLGKRNEVGLNDQGVRRRTGGYAKVSHEKEREELVLGKKGSLTSPTANLHGTGMEKKADATLLSPSISPVSSKSQRLGHPRSSRGKKIGRRYRKQMTVKGETPDDFIRRTACPQASSSPVSAKGLAERASQALQLSSPTHVASSSAAFNAGIRMNLEQRQLSQEIKEMLKNDVRFSEAPNLSLAHQANYYSTARDDALPPSGIGIGVPSAPLVDKHPTEPCQTYPPLPVKYASYEEERRAMGLQRLKSRVMKGSSSAEKSPSKKNEFVAALSQDDSRDIDEEYFGYRVKEGSVLDYTFRAGSAGEDSSIVSLFVKELIDSRQQAQEEWKKKQKLREAPLVGVFPPGKDSNYTNNVVKKSPLPHKPVFSVMESLLKVSREFEMFQQTKNKNGMKNSSVLSACRQEAVAQLVGFQNTRIPEEFWLSITDKSLSACTRFFQKRASLKSKKNEACDDTNGSMKSEPGESGGAETDKSEQGSVNCEDLDNCSHVCNRSRSKDAGSDATVIFPGAKPVERSQVYLLADVLDLMLMQIEDCSVLFDAELAKKILPSSAPSTSNNEEWSEFNRASLVMPYAKSEQSGGIMDTKKSLSSPSEAINPLLLPEVQQRSVEAHLKYATVTEKVVTIFDIGISEVVRQIGSYCIERGALLDTLRQCLVDVTKSSLNLLYHAKEVAFREASKRQDNEKQLQRTERRMLEQALRIQELEMDNAALYEWNSTLQLKASRMDTLLQRVEEKKKRFEFHTEDEHAILLMELEKDMAASATKAVETLNMEKAALTEDPHQPSGQAPTAAAARKRLLDNQSAMETLYAESAELLTALYSCTTTTNKACGPLYDNVSLGTLSPSANLPAAKWASIARAVGDFEKDKAHRLRVFHVFSEWCNRFRKIQRSDEDTDKEGNFLLASSSDDSDKGSLFNDSGASSLSVNSDVKGTLVQRRSSSAVKRSGKGISELETREKQLSRLFQSTIGENSKGSKPQDSTVDEELSSPEMKFITYQDLQDMKVYDCTPDEVNAMFARSFDFKSYLHSAWEPSESHFTLNISDVADMVHDVRVFIQELTIRMHALSDGAVMRKGIEPPLNPPVHPEIPCPLCGRRESTGERRKHQETLQQIAREVQNQMEELTRKFQKAESEREDARMETRRLHQELNEALEREAALRVEIGELLRYRFIANPGETTKELRQRESVASTIPRSPSNYSAGTAPYATIQNNTSLYVDLPLPGVLHAVVDEGKSGSRGMRQNLSGFGREKIRSPSGSALKKKRSFVNEMLLSMSELLSNQHERSSNPGSGILQNEGTQPNEVSGEITQNSRTDLLVQDSALFIDSETRDLDDKFSEKKSLSSSCLSGDLFSLDTAAMEKSKSHD